MATITGTSGNDTLRGTSGSDQLLGLGGNDLLLGSAGSDRLDGGSGSDTINYASLPGSIHVDLAAGVVIKNAGGQDTLVSIGNAIGTNGADVLVGNANQNALEGGSGDDVLQGDAGNDTLDGGPGSDRVSYSGSIAGVGVDLAAGTAQDGLGGDDRIISVGLVTGSSHGDVLKGNSNSNTLDGGDGNDRIFGRDGDDLLLGGAGDDLLDGGNGSDTVSYWADQGGPVIVNLAIGTATDGTGGIDSIISCGNVIGTPEDGDVVIGNENANIINGIGTDRLTGNGGADTFVTNSWDWWGATVSDFQRGVDKLSVSLRATPVSDWSPGPLPAADFTTGAPATTHWTFTYDRGTGVVGFDLDGSGPDIALTVVTLANKPVLDSGDFILA